MKIASSAEWLDLLPPAPTIGVQGACGEPQTLLETLIAGIRENRPNLLGATLYTLTYRDPTAPTPIYGDKELLSDGRLKLRSVFPHPMLREVSQLGLVDYVPTSLSNFPGLIRNGFIKCDVAFFQISAPDENGLCSLGPTADYAVALAETTPLWIGEINKQMPRVNGPKLPVERFAALIESDRPLVEVTPPPVGEIERRVAQNVASLIGDGATIQLGVGTVPEETARMLTGHRNLNIHSGTITDPIIELLESGAVTNTRKPFDQGLSTVAMLIGTKKLFDYAHENPRLSLQPVDLVNSISRLSQLPNFVSINSAIEVDYWGQANAEAVGSWQLAGIGGQLDFVQGAWGSKDGLSIIALPSVTAKGHPRIVPRLKEGAPISTPRHVMQVVVTENGVADLRGKSLSEREKLLKKLIS